MKDQMGRYENILQRIPADSALSFLYIPGKIMRWNEEEHLDELRWHEELEIKYFLSGKAEILCGPRVFIAQAGDVVAINSCEMHGIRSYGEEDVQYHLLMLPPDLFLAAPFQELLAPLFSGAARLRSLIRGDEKLGGIMENLFDCLEKREKCYEMEANGYLTALLACLLRQYAAKGQEQQSHLKYADKLRPAVDYIYRHYHEEIRTEELAQICSLSLYHFSRLFKKVTGLTVSDYVYKMRMEKAAAMLMHSNLPISLISREVGYGDECYFSRCFHGWAGCAPSAYRKKKKEQNNPGNWQGDAWEQGKSHAIIQSAPNEKGE